MLEKKDTALIFVTFIVFAIYTAACVGAGMGLYPLFHKNEKRILKTDPLAPPPQPEVEEHKIDMIPAVFIRDEIYRLEKQAAEAEKTHDSTDFACSVPYIQSEYYKILLRDWEIYKNDRASIFDNAPDFSLTPFGTNKQEEQENKYHATFSNNTEN